MPIYEYVCSVCGHRLEVMHGLHGHGPATCPECGGAMRKAFAPPHVVFKGTGWARKDRSSSSAPKRSKTGSKEEASSGSSGADSSTGSKETGSGSGGSSGTD